MVSEERREVGGTEKELTGKIEGMKSLALLAIERRKHQP